MWFEKLTGFEEESPQQVRNNITNEGELLISHVNNNVMKCGVLETPRLADLRERISSSNLKPGKNSVREVISNVQHLHADLTNAGSLFQVASQFNLLEMTSPTVNPEQGVGIYENDRTQGPACAVAAGAGTIYRNYFAVVNDQIGQSKGNQIDCLADIGEELGNTDQRLWSMTNGYALASRVGLEEISKRLESSSEAELDKLRSLLRIGLQWNTEVTIADSRHTVSQVYCSALPVAYSRHPSILWEKFARIILEASYEATICTAALNYLATGNNRLFLTLIGGGVFGNDINWIIGAIHRALNIYKDIGLDIMIVSYGSSNMHVQELVGQFR